jgi:hypothetical protein
MTIEPHPTSEFILTTKNEIEDQITELMGDLQTRLTGKNYRREINLGFIFSGLTPRSIPNWDRITKEDLIYSTWLIAELKGRLQVQLAHKNMQKLIPHADSYNYILHACIVGTLQAEFNLFLEMLEIYNRTPATTNLIDNFQKRLDINNTETAKVLPVSSPKPVAPSFKPKPKGKEQDIIK